MEPTGRVVVHPCAGNEPAGTVRTVGASEVQQSMCATVPMTRPREWDDPAELQRLLQTNLDRHEIQTREGGGAGKVPYVEGWRVIDKAQRIFGFDGWSSKILELKKEFESQDASSKRWSVGYSSSIRVELKDGTFHEDVGFGTVLNEKDRGKAIENARKEAVTDGLKRTLRLFGAALGNSVYDKQHVKEVKLPSSKPPPQGRTTDAVRPLPGPPVAPTTVAPRPRPATTTAAGPSRTEVAVTAAHAPGAAMASHAPAAPPGPQAGSAVESLHQRPCKRPCHPCATESLPSELSLKRPARDPPFAVSALQPEPQLWKPPVSRVQSAPASAGPAPTHAQNVMTSHPRALQDISAMQHPAAPQGIVDFCDDDALLALRC